MSDDETPLNEVDENETMTIYTRDIRGETEEYQVKPSDTISLLKKQILAKKDFPSQAEIGLIFKGKILKESTTLKENGIQPETYLNIIINLSKNEKPSQSTPTQSTPIQSKFSPSLLVIIIAVGVIFLIIAVKFGSDLN